MLWSICLANLYHDAFSRDLCANKRSGRYLKVLSCLKRLMYDIDECSMAN